MRGSFAAVTIVGTVFFTVACGESTSPASQILAPSASSTSLDLPAVPPQVPFKGTFEGLDAISPGPVPNTFVTNTTVTGTATHLGHFSFAQTLTRVLPSPTATGSAVWTAANGDTIETTVAASAIPGPLVVTRTEIHTVTGGTGRFSGALGTFTVDRTHVRAQNADGTFNTFGTYEGTITSPGAAH
jgi:hypothetical protein